MALHTIPISDTLFDRLRREAAARQRPVEEIAQDAIERYLPASIEEENEALSPMLKAELEAMHAISDSGLWALASGSLNPVEWQELKWLGAEGRERQLSEIEKQRQQSLLLAYDAMLLRRAHAAVLLKARGYDVSDPSIFN